MATDNCKNPKTISGGDFLSKFPDDIVLNILSKLPLKDNFRTSILSKRFKHLRSESSISIKDESLLSYADKEAYANDSDSLSGNKIISVVENIDSLLASHRGPILSFHLSFINPASVNGDDNYLKRWLEMLHLRVEDLCFHYSQEKFPLCPFSSFNSLRKLELYSCSLLSHFTFSFPSLTNLIFMATSISDQCLDAILLSPALEYVQLGNCNGFRSVRIRSQSLQELTLRGCNLVIIEDAPILRSIELWSLTKHLACLRIVHAPKLEYLSMFNVEIKAALELGSTSFQHHVSSNIALICPVKRIFFNLDFNDVEQTKMVYAMLKCFPCLETLDILAVEKLPTNVEDLEYWEQQYPLACLDRHLKMITLRGYSKQDAHTGFIKFLIMKAQVLNTMTIFTYESTSSEDQWNTWAKSVESLFNKEKASAQALIVFERRYY